MITKIYLFIRYFIIFFIALSITVLVVASHPQTAVYLGEKFLKENGVEYSKLEGSLLSGLTLHDVNYAGAVNAERVTLEYTLLNLLSLTPKITKLESLKLSVTPKNFPKSSDENGSEFMMIPLALTQLNLSKTKIIFDNETISFDLNASDIRYVNALDVKTFALHLGSFYGDVTADGKIKSNHLYAKSLVTPQKSVSDEYLNFLTGLPKTYNLELDATLQRAVLKTNLRKVSLTSEQNLTLQNTELNLSYFVESKHFNLDTSYLFSYDQFSANVKQNVLFNPNGDYTSDLNATLTKSSLELPFNSFSAKLYGDTKNMTTHIKAGPLQFDLMAKGYEQFVLHAHGKEIPLAFVSALPDILKKNVIALRGDVILDLSPFSMKGAFETDGLYSNIDGSFKIDSDSKQLLVALHPKAESDIWSGFPLKKFSAMNFIYYENNETSVVNLDSDKLNLTVFRDGKSLSGFGNFGSANFESYGAIMDDKDANITFFAHVPSADALLSEFMQKDTNDNSFFDAEVDINSTLNFSEKLTVKSRINVPWFIVKPDTTTSYRGENLYIESTLKDNELRVENYTLNIMEHHLYSQRASKISFDENATLNFEEFWIYDNLLLTGLINVTDMQGNLQMKSEGFKYETKEGYVKLRADVKADFESNGTQNIEGSITLLDGTITYEPSSDYTLSDDIIIIQDMKPFSSAKRFVNLHINSEKPITYKSKEVDIKINPDLIIWQDLEKPLSIYGMLTIEEGNVTAGGKVFEFEKSEIYFSGADPINPYLNLNLHYYTLDYVDIEIFITNTLASPVVILSSSPQMSQDDIMSYILFGERASTAFDSSGGGTSNQAVSSLILATGLKEMISDTAGIKIDTFNILTNEEGTLGYEIGTRLNRRVRLIYKNDTVSSVILQYSLSKSVRIDVNVHETGQGVSIIYIKDF